ncbi:hypothetical protein DSO57_1034539 [Entomophthora muscae]|uniref:Uncharacterized protein n=1 Tax=Entomophthora muscae TaxID=34485 RepID=A0ACC2SZW5_9FUNG|nr:hypothetical protein DSO57_1034539 [Entomophthora muscae]
MILLGIGLVIVFIAALASWDVICDSYVKRSCRIGVVIPLIASFFAAWLLKVSILIHSNMQLHFYFVLNSYVDQLKKDLFVLTNVDQVVIPVTPIFEQTPHLPVQETPHPEPPHAAMPQPYSGALV